MIKKVGRQIDLQKIIGVFAIILCCIGVSLLRPYNSDDIYLYSQSLDLLAYGSLKGWHFSAVPFTFPDLLLAIPAAILTRDPFIFHVLTAPLMLLLFAVVYFQIAYEIRPLSRTGWYLAFSCALLCVTLIGLLTFKKPWYFLIEPVFILDHHGGAAVSSILVFYFLKNYKKSFLSIVSIVIIIGALTASDFFFAFYLCFFLLFNVRRSEAASFLILLFVFLQSMAVFAISWKLNPSLVIQATQTSTNKSTDFFLIRFSALWHVALYCTTLFLVWFYGVKINKSVKNLSPYVFGSICAALFAAVSGLVSDIYTYRYATILFPVTVVVLAHMFVPFVERNKHVISYVVIAIPTAILFVIGPKFGLQSANTFHPEITCLRDHAPVGSTLIAEYWPAKIIFEKTGRRYNLNQVNPDGDQETWIFNDRWRDIYPSTGRTFVILGNLSSKGLQRFQSRPDSKTLCDGRVLELRPLPE